MPVNTPQISATHIYKHPKDSTVFVADFSQWICSPVKIEKVVSVESEPGLDVSEADETKHDDVKVSFNASGGTAGHEYLVTIGVELSDGSVIYRGFPFRVVDH